MWRQLNEVSNYSQLTKKNTLEWCDEKCIEIQEASIEFNHCWDAQVSEKPTKQCQFNHKIQPKCIAQASRESICGPAQRIKSEESWIYLSKEIQDGVPNQETKSKKYL